MTYLADIGGYLAAANLVTENLVVGTNLHYQTTPDDPATCVILYETAGRAPEHLFGPGPPAYEYRGMQVVTRAATHPTAVALAREVWTALLGIVNQTVGGARYLRCDALQSPFPLDRDDKKRLRVICNYMFTVET